MNDIVKAFFLGIRIAEARHGVHCSKAMTNKEISEEAAAVEANPPAPAEVSARVMRMLTGQVHPKFVNTDGFTGGDQ